MKDLLQQSQFCRGVAGAVRQLPGDLRRGLAYLRRQESIRCYLETHAVRKLQIGGGPNALWAMANHVSGELETDRRENLYCPAYVINNFFWDFSHYFVYDLETLVSTLNAAGFLDAVVCAPGESAARDLCGLESHGALIGEEYNRFETMVVEARKP